MASRKVLLIASATMAIIVGDLLQATAFPNNYLVGDLDGWNFDVDYDEWAKSMTNLVKAGDTIEFCYDEGLHSVVQVEEEGYKNCDPTNPVNIWTTGDDIVQLEAGTSFFICGLGDHCSNRGMKFAIIVGDLLQATTFPNNYLVGDLDGWDPDVNLGEWAASITDLVKAGDTLEFCYDQGVYNVVQVEEEDYKTCNPVNHVNIWTTGDDIVQLEAGTSFFICGLGDHCRTSDMKFAITAKESDE